MRSSNLFFIFVMFVAISCSSSQSGMTTTQSATEVNPSELSNLDLTAYLKRISGLTINGSGANATVRVRGVSSISGNNDPLFILDGTTLGYGLRNAYSAVDPTNIKNVRVLKPGSQTTIYGSRGAAGVIIITTKGN